MLPVIVLQYNVLSELAVVVPVRDVPLKGHSKEVFVAHAVPLLQ